MTVFETTLPMAFAECKDLAIVYSYETAVLLYGLQQQHGDWRHVCYGRELTDGRWMIGGEILAMVGPGDPYSWIVDHATSELLQAIEVVPLSSVELAPPPEELP